MIITEKIIRQKVAAGMSHFIKIRRDFHQFPELGLVEYRTADKIQHYLKSWQMDPGVRINKTSIVSMIKGNGSSKTVIGLRADMDALPIQELNNHDYKSIYQNVMHACGHDVHMTIQLGAAYILNQIKDDLPGDVKLFFQQAEETVGGAKTMIEAGVLENPTVDHVIGLHVCPKLPVGTFGIKYQQAYAASDTMTIYVHGQKAHGAAPQDGIDAIVVASHIVIAIQALISRNTSPLEAAVISFGMIKGGVAHNVIADDVLLKGTLRTLDPQVRNMLKQRLFQVADHVAKAYDAQITLRIETGYDALVNDDAVTNVIKEVAQRILGESNVKILKDPSLGVEDFAYFAKACPSGYHRLGVKNAELGVVAPLHDGKFDVDEAAIEYGVLIQVMSVLALMGVVIDD